jgi:hypothetical protein
MGNGERGAAGTVTRSPAVKMTEIRPLEASDLKAVVKLLRANLRGWSGDELFVAAQTFDHPWADPELPSLVAVDDDGALVGFIAAQPRRLLLDDAPLRGVCCSQLTVDPNARTTGAGALLLKRAISGPQDLTWSDISTDLVARMWNALGGDRDHSRACDWMLVLRPLSWAAGAARALLRGSLSRELVPVPALPVRRGAGGEPGEGVTGEQASTAALVEALPQIARGIRLRVDHDEPHLDHMFAELERHYGGEPVVRRLVRHGGRAIGWYAYLRRERGLVAQVRHLAATEAHADAVLDELISHLRGEGTAVLTGRAEPHMAGALGRRHAALGYARYPVMHAREPEVAAVLASGASLLTRLDGEPFAT